MEDGDVDADKILASIGPRPTRRPRPGIAHSLQRQIVVSGRASCRCFYQATHRVMPDQRQVKIV